jgi:hypothetical protein
MLTEREVLSTIEMVKNEHLDVRTVTLGINLFDCASDDLNRFQDKIYQRITGLAGDLVKICDEFGDIYGIPIVNKRIAISPIGVVGAPFSTSQMVSIARTLDQAAKDVNIDFIGGFGCLVQKGMATGDIALIDSIPEP